MRILLRCCVGCVVLFALAADPAGAQTRPRVGLALSGGGAKGFAHIGVLKVLEEVGMPIDYLAGTSMGCIMASLYSAGYRAEALERLSREIDWQDVFSDAIQRRYLAMQEKLWDGRYMASFPIRRKSVALPAGLIAGQKISTLLARLTWPVHHVEDFRELPIPCACVATDLGTGEAVTLNSGFLPEAMRASMAIPTAFTPVRFHNLLLADGGLVRNLPAEDVRALGAQIVIGVDVGATLHAADSLVSFLDIITQSLSFVEATSRTKQRGLCNVLIVPDIRGISTLDFDRVEAAIQRGEEAARRQLPQLRALADSLNRLAPPEPRFVVPRVDSIYIRDLEIEGLRDVSHRLVLSELNLHYPAWLTSQELEQAIDRLYGTQFFERVTYQLEPYGQGMRLTIRVIEKTAELLHIGLRYDRKTKAALLLGATVRNVAEHGSALVLEARLGDDVQFDGQYYVHLGKVPSLGLRGRATHQRLSLSFYDDGRETARLRYHTTAVDAFAGSIFSTVVATGIGVRSEYASFSPDIAPREVRSFAQDLMVVYGLLWMDTLDRAVFPTRGATLQLKSEFSHPRIASEVAFTRHSLELRGFVPLGDKVTWLSGVEAGTSRGAGLPLHYQFFPGGADFFLGYEPRELAGRHAQALMLGLQYEVMPRRFLQLRGNIGNASERRRDLFRQRHQAAGLALTAGALTPIGPVEITLMHSARHHLLTHFNIGYKF